MWPPHATTSCSWGAAPAAPCAKVQEGAALFHLLDNGEGAVAWTAESVPSWATVK